MHQINPVKQPYLLKKYSLTVEDFQNQTFYDFDENRDYR
jgi:hypothetical protein